MEGWQPVEMSRLLKDAEQMDLVNYGLIPEFVGRFPVICSLQVRPTRQALTNAAVAPIAC